MFIAFIIGFIVIALDQLSKFLVEYFKPSALTIIPHFIEFDLTHNTGAAFSMLDDGTAFLAVLSLFSSIVLIYVIKKYADMKNKKIFTISLAFIFGGCVGNLIDRSLTMLSLKDGVTDFIKMYLINYEFPGVFNVADAFLVVGVILLALSILFSKDVNNNEDVKN